MRLLILGGYGVFGGRLAELLSDLPQLEILIAGRTLTKAEAKCKVLRGKASFTPVELDRVNIVDALAEHSPGIVIDATGPFQDYGDAPYFVIEACIEAGVHYLDFADAADFVFGVSQFDGAAKAAGVTVLSGVSSFPVLTAAILRQFQKHMTVHSLTGGIAPSPYAGIGLNVMRAVVSYAGDDVKLTKDGKQTTGKGLAESLRYTIAPPGYLPLKNLHFSLVDVPDLQVLPAQNSDMTDIWMGAGPVPEILHKVLNLLAKARAALPLPSFGPLSPFFYWVLNKMKFGEHRGGMFIAAKGVDANGNPAARSWHLLAEGDDGPYIPSMAIAAIVRKWSNGVVPETGARAATHALELDDYLSLFETREIYTAFRNDIVTDAPITEQVLADQFDALPDRLQHFHGQTGAHKWRGEADVVAARNPLAKLAAAIAGLKVTTGHWPLNVTVTPKDDAEIWRRDFGSHAFQSRFSLGKGKNAHMLTEQFGPAKITLALVLDGKTLRFVPRRMTLYGVTMPNWLLPKEDSYEHEENGKFHFNVNVKVPIIGHIAHYKGWLEKVG